MAERIAAKFNDDEALSEALLALVEASKTYDPSLETPRHTYYKRAVWRKLIGWYRREQLRKKILAPITAAAKKPCRHNYHEVVDIEDYMNSLPSLTRQIIMLKSQGFTVGEIQKRLKLSVREYYKNVYSQRSAAEWV